jgi:hypothetical protein
MRRGRLAEMMGGAPVGGGVGGVPYDQSGLLPDDQMGLAGAADVPPGQGMPQPPVPDAPLGVTGDATAQPEEDPMGQGTGDVVPEDGSGDVVPPDDGMGDVPQDGMGAPEDTGAMSNDDLGSMLDSTPEDALVQDMQAGLQDPNQAGDIEQELALAARRQLLNRGR